MSEQQEWFDIPRWLLVDQLELPLGDDSPECLDSEEVGDE